MADEENGQVATPPPEVPPAAPEEVTAVVDSEDPPAPEAAEGEEEAETAEDSNDIDKDDDEDGSGEPVGTEGDADADADAAPPADGVESQEDGAVDDGNAAAEGQEAVEGPVARSSAAAPPVEEAVPEGEGEAPPAEKKAKEASQEKPAAAASRRLGSRRPSGREVILRSSSAADGTRATGNAAGRSQTAGRSGTATFSTGPHLNGQQLTTEEENLRFRLRNKVATNFRGPVYVAEDVQVPCAGCGGPVDPISRVPAGNLFFHIGCVVCHVCRRSSPTDNFFQVGETDTVLCMGCMEKGFEPSVRRELRSAQTRLASRPMYSAGTASSLNRAVLPGATAPTLAIGPLHNRRNTSHRSFDLMQRQQYFTQSDVNVIMAPSMVNAAAAQPAPGVEGETRRAPQITARRRSTARGSIG